MADIQELVKDTVQQPNLGISMESAAVDHDIPDSPNDQQCDENIEPIIKNSKEETTIESPSNVKGEMEHIGSKVISHRNEAGNFPCDRCDKIYKDRSNFKRHFKSAHEGIRFKCNDCEYEATTKQHLFMHIQAIHEVKKGKKFYLVKHRTY